MKGKEEFNENLPVIIEKSQVQYSEQGLREKLGKVARRAGLKVVYAVLLLYYALNSPSISTKDKSIIYGALGYFILPLDLLPDVLPVVGFTDDLSAILLALHAIWKNITPEVKAMAAAKASEIFSDFDQDRMDRELADEQ